MPKKEIPVIFQEKNKRICRQTERGSEFCQKRNEKLEIVQSERVASAGRRKGGVGGIPPALQILGEICSNFFERTPHASVKQNGNQKIV